MALTQQGHWWRILSPTHAAGCSAANREQRVRDNGVPAHHSLSRTTLSAGFLRLILVLVCGAKWPGSSAFARLVVGKASPERKALETGRQFRRGYRFRAGIEGRIHVLRRDRGLRRCRYHGESGMGRWVGWGIVTHNLTKVAEAGAAR